jgi:hypothetical protein
VLSGPNEVELDTALVSPFVEHFGGKFRAVVDRDRPRQRAML